MVRETRVQEEDTIYHVMSHSIEEQRFFRMKEDYRSFLGILGKAQQRYKLKVFAYCLLTNHYHILMETPLGNLGAAMQYLNGVYAMACNGRKGRRGHLTRCRYNARVIEDNDYFQTVANYIAFNPVGAGLAVRPEDWLFSSYRATIGLSKPPRFLDVKGLLGYLNPFGANPGEQPSKYLRNTGSTQWEFDERLVLVRPTLSEIFSNAETGPAICEAINRWEYRQSDIADFLGVNKSTVGRKLKKCTKSA